MALEYGGISAMYKMNKSRPRSDPRGTANNSSTVEGTALEISSMSIERVFHQWMAKQTCNLSCLKVKVGVCCKWKCKRLQLFMTDDR